MKTPHSFVRMEGRNRRAPGCIAMAALPVILTLSLTSCLTNYFYDQAVARKPKTFLSNSKDLNMSDYEKSYARSREWFEKAGGERLSVTSFDGLVLKARYVPAKNPTNGTVILAHGYSASGESMGSFAAFYHDELGYNVLAPDARGHGESEGNYIGFGWHDRLDYLNWIGLVISMTGPDARIVLHGVSMGGATVLMTAGETLPPQVEAVVSDCAYTSAYEELAYQLKRLYNMEEKPLLPDTSRLAKERAGYFFEEASALNQVAKARVPILFIHGDADTFVPFEMARRLYDACPSEKKLVVFPGAGHALAWSSDRELYVRELTAFLDGRM